MKRIVKVVGVAAVVAILGAVALGAVAYADEGSPGPFDFRERFHNAVADILGISPTEYESAVEQARKKVVDEAIDEGWLTEDQAEMMQERMEQGFGMKGRFMAPQARFGLGTNSIVDTAAELIGISTQDLIAELSDGKSLNDVITENGIDPQEVIDAHLTQLEENLSQMVEDGKITQEQADLMLEQAAETAPDHLDGSCEGRPVPFGFSGEFPGGFPHGFPGGRRPGGMLGFPAGQDV